MGINACVWLGVGLVLSLLQLQGADCNVTSSTLDTPTTLLTTDDVPSTDTVSASGDTPTNDSLSTPGLSSPADEDYNSESDSDVPDEGTNPDESSFLSYSDFNYTDYYDVYVPYQQNPPSDFLKNFWQSVFQEYGTTDRPSENITVAALGTHWSSPWLTALIAIFSVLSVALVVALVTRIRRITSLLKTSSGNRSKFRRRDSSKVDIEPGRGQND
ncbi:uncharacterized protein [Ptychodera flava]|uniref:uncharacterized protein n=1 Tax=Ptychodera flava TaxID=63121 RepID=UPI00396A811A